MFYSFLPIVAWVHTLTAVCPLKLNVLMSKIEIPQQENVKVES